MTKRVREAIKRLENHMKLEVGAARAASSQFVLFLEDIVAVLEYAKAKGAKR